MLSGFDIEHLIKTGRLGVTPFSKDSVRENGMDFRLANEIARHAEFKKGFVLDPSNQSHIESSYKIEKDCEKGGMVIKAQEQVLLSTVEFISMPDDHAGFVELRSTWARHGLSMPPTIIDAGFEGNVTLEVVNNAPYDILLKPNLRFAHIVFNKLNNKASDPYKGTYYGQKGIKLPKPIREKK